MIKKLAFFMLALSCTITAIAQQNYQASKSPTLILTPKSFHVSEPVRNSPVCDDLSTFDGYIVPKNGVLTTGEMSNKRKRKLAHLNSAGKSSSKVDPLIGKSYQATHETATRAPITSFEGIGANVSPPDPSMAVGPNHVVTMENGVWAVYDKFGILAPTFPKPLNDPLSGPNHADNAGDPVVMYDREADRWFISQFQLQGNASLSDDVFLIGVSTTPDPTGAYNVYEYELTQGNDYPHYGIWGDTYVTAGNFTGAQKVYTFNRTKMLAGDPSAEIAGFSPANLGASGFAAPIPVHSEAAGAATGPAKILYYQDDAFGGVTSDHIGMWTIDMDWNNIPGSVISAKTEIPTSPFDAAIAGGFSNLQQPGTNVRIDAIVGAVMNMSHWYKFDTHESIILNWVVEVADGSQVSGIRWAELRSFDNGATWSLYQEGTFTDPTGNDSVFMGCMSMDKDGNIAMGYTKTGAATFPSLYYTGRKAGDFLGEMTYAEDLAIAGNTVTTNDRYGDYGQGVRDPNDDLTIWVTSEYSGAPDKKVRVYSFKLADQETTDVGVSDIVTPVTGNGLSNAESVTINISNYGTTSQSNIPLTLSLEGTQVASEMYTGTIAPGAIVQYTFTQTIDLSAVQDNYIIQSCTNLAGDQQTANECANRKVSNLAGTDLAITAISSPVTGEGLTATEDVSFTLSNLGGLAQSNIPLIITTDGGVPVNGTFPGPVAAGESVNLTLADVADVLQLGNHTVCVEVNQGGDAVPSNNLFCQDLVHLSCTASGGSCNQDGIKRFVLGTIDIDDGGLGCNTEPADGPTGYANRMNLSTDLDRVNGLNTHILQAQTSWNVQNLTVWIDFNDNATFEPSELLINQSYGGVEDALVDFNLVIPTDAALGSHIIRLKSFDDGGTGDATDPCGDVQFGEMHDYTVNIIDSVLGDCPTTTTYAGGSWDNGAPTASVNAIINGTYNTTTASIDACSLVVNGTLTVSADSYINIVNDIEVAPSGTLNVAHTGSVVQVEDAAIVKKDGTINVALNTPNLDVLDFMIMGSPMDAETRESVWAAAWNVQNYTPANFNPLGTVTDAYNFADAELDDWNLYTNGTLNAGEGFLVRPQTSISGAGGIFSYNYTTGTLNNGVVTRALNFNTEQLDSPNMLSNPYASAIDADAFLAANDEIDALYFWEHNTAPSTAFPGANGTGPNYTMGDVSFYNAVGPMAAATGGAAPTAVISTGQGFATFANAAGTATFNNSMRSTGANNTFRNSDLAKNRVWLNIASDVYSIGGSTLIGFLDGATEGFESKYDSQRMATHVSIFSHIDSSDIGFAVQGREAFENDKKVSIGFSSIIEEVTSYTISLANFDGIAMEYNTPYLVDTVTGTITNLKEGSYSFTSDKGVFNNRFVLQFENSVLGSNDISLDVITVFPNPTKDIVTVSSPISEILTIEVIDITGRVIMSTTPNTTKTQIDLSNQNTSIYFVKISTEKGTIVKKILKK